VIGIFTDDGLIAYNVLYFPGVDGDNFGTDIALPSDELDKVVHLETVAVHPAFRGTRSRERWKVSTLGRYKKWDINTSAAWYRLRTTRAFKIFFPMDWL